MDKQGRRHDDYKVITCSCCGEKAKVPKTRRFLCETCFSGHPKRIQWEVVNSALTNYLAKEGIQLLELVPHGKWRPE